LNKIFPIKSDTACLLKWAWSTIFLSIGKTSSCHRVDHDILTLDTFDTFHNTPRKLDTRELMQKGKWPEQGCEYCRKIEDSGGTSDRQFQLEAMQYDIPPELMRNPTANKVTPTILEVYFNNTCNMSCLYCGPHFSSVWEAENTKHGLFRHNTVGLLPSDHVSFNTNYDKMLEKFWEWMKNNAKHLGHFHVLGGEPFHQKELEQCIDFFEDYGCPNLTFVIVSNLKVDHNKFKIMIDRLLKLKSEKKLKAVQISGSLDTWGPEAEYIRWGLNLNEFETNMRYLLDKDITICINAAINALSIKSMPQYIRKIGEWNKIRLNHWNNDPYRKIVQSFMTINYPLYLKPDIFDETLFTEDFKEILALMHPFENDSDYVKQSYEHLIGIEKQIRLNPKNSGLISDLKVFLDEMDRRRGTNWRTLFPWLELQ
jgi:organic radical activating enzyme